MVQLEGWFRSWVPDSVFSAGGGRSSVEVWYTTALDIEEVLSGGVDFDIHLSVVDVIKSFDIVDRSILDRVLSSLGLPAWFRHAYFEYHSHVWLRFKLAAGLGKSWTRDGGIPQGCPSSMMFVVALYLPWCRFLAAQEGVEPQLYADNFKCASRDPGVLLRAARFTTSYVRLVGQEPTPSKCVLMSTSRAVRKDMRGWLVTDEGGKWSVKLDVRDLGRRLDTTFRGWSATLATGVRLIIVRLVLLFVLSLLIRVYVSCALPYLKLPGLAVSLLPMLVQCRGCDPAFCVVWFQCPMLRRYLAYRPSEVPRVYRLLDSVTECCFGHGPVHLLVESASEIGFQWDSLQLGWERLGLPVLSNLAGPIQHFRAAILDAWRGKVSADLCARKGFRGSPWLDVEGILQFLNSDHVRERWGTA